MVCGGTLRFHELPKSTRLHMCHYWDNETTPPTLRQCTFHHWLQQLRNKRFLIITGRSRWGKSQTLHTIGKSCCRKTWKGQYAIHKAIDHFGLATKHHTLNQNAFIAITDAELVVLMNSEMTQLERMSLWDIAEGGGFRSRYHPTLLQPGIARGMAVNSNKDSAGSWFRDRGMLHIAALCEQNVAYLSAHLGLARVSAALLSNSAFPDLHVPFRGYQGTRVLGACLRVLGACLRVLGY